MARKKRLHKDHQTHHKASCNAYPQLNQDLQSAYSAPLNPTWSPDGGWIAFTSTQSSHSQDIFVMRPDGSGVTNLTQSDGSTDYEPVWSPVPLPAQPTVVFETSWGQIKSGN